MSGHRSGKKDSMARVKAVRAGMQKWGTMGDARSRKMSSTDDDDLDFTAADYDESINSPSELSPSDRAYSKIVVPGGRRSSVTTSTNPESTEESDSGARRRSSSHAVRRRKSSSSAALTGDAKPRARTPTRSSGSSRVKDVKSRISGIWKAGTLRDTPKSKGIERDTPERLRQTGSGGKERGNSQSAANLRPRRANSPHSNRDRDPTLPGSSTAVAMRGGKSPKSAGGTRRGASPGSERRKQNSSKPKSSPKAEDVQTIASAMSNTFFTFGASTASTTSGSPSHNSSHDSPVARPAVRVQVGLSVPVGEVAAPLSPLFPSEDIDSMASGGPLPQSLRLSSGSEVSPEKSKGGGRGHSFLGEAPATPPSPSFPSEEPGMDDESVDLQALHDGVMLESPPHVKGKKVPKAKRRTEVEPEVDPDEDTLSPAPAILRSESLPSGVSGYRSGLSPSAAAASAKRAADRERRRSVRKERKEKQEEYAQRERAASSGGSMDADDMSKSGGSCDIDERKREHQQKTEKRSELLQEKGSFWGLSDAAVGHQPKVDTLVRQSSDDSPRSAVRSVKRTAKWQEQEDEQLMTVALSGKPLEILESEMDVVRSKLELLQLTSKQDTDITEALASQLEALDAQVNLRRQAEQLQRSLQRTHDRLFSELAMVRMDLEEANTEFSIRTKDLRLRWVKKFNKYKLQNENRVAVRQRLIQELCAELGRPVPEFTEDRLVELERKTSARRKEFDAARARKNSDL